MPSIAQRVKIKRNELVRHIAQLEKELVSLEEKRALLAEILGQDGGDSAAAPVRRRGPGKRGPGKRAAANEDGTAAEAPKGGRGKRKAARKARYNGRPVREVILEILGHGKAPMPVKDISAALKAQGIDVAVNTVFTSLKQLRTTGAVASHEHAGPGNAFALA